MQQAIENNGAGEGNRTLVFSLEDYCQAGQSRSGRDRKPLILLPFLTFVPPWPGVSRTLKDTG
jgi:hypothetical protein